MSRKNRATIQLVGKWGGGRVIGYLFFECECASAVLSGSVKDNHCTAILSCMFTENSRTTFRLPLCFLAFLSESGCIHILYDLVRQW